MEGRQAAYPSQEWKARKSLGDQSNQEGPRGQRPDEMLQVLVSIGELGRESKEGLGQSGGSSDGATPGPGARSFADLARHGQVSGEDKNMRAKSFDVASSGLWQCQLMRGSCKRCVS